MSYTSLHLQVTVHVALIPPICALVIINTTNIFQYTYIEDFGLTIRGVRDIIFMVKATNDAHVALSRTKGISEEDSYEVVIGGWKNQRSVIRQCDQCKPKITHFHSPLNPLEYRPFWIRWDEGLIRVGNGSVPLEAEFMQWQNNNAHDVNHLGISTGWKSTGSWVFDFAPPVWASWQAWDSCDTTCNVSIRWRMRNCLLHQLHYGINCFGPATESQSCDVPMCPIDGGWTDWGGWTTCTHSCGPGLQSRRRECANPFPEYGGEKCPGDDRQIRRCDYGSCAVDGKWSVWSAWSQCTTSCGGGLQLRNRSCNNPAPQFGGQNCSGSTSQRRTCSPNNCPIDGKWSNWTDWTQCTHSCGGGLQERTRSCDHPSPQYGGFNCTGNTTQIQSCSINNCPIDGKWSNWSSWTQCTHTCGGGVQERTRSCDHPSPQYGGFNCTGNNTQIENCSINNCPIDGRWSVWTKWTGCNVTCGGGTQWRARYCTDPVPQYGGKICGGHDSETKQCGLQKCPVAGDWSVWQQWSKCSTTCGDGIQTRSRQCDNPAPQFRGADCQGQDRETISCNVTPCPVNGDWSKWSKWNTCTTTCGNGSQSRSRDCNNPSPRHGGSNCEGNNQEYKTCSVQPCPVDGYWSGWAAWSDCSSTCGEGFAFRERDCSNPSPQHGGLMCSDHPTENKTCFDAECPIAGEWSHWEQWSSCSRQCGYGTQKRHRQCNKPLPQHGGDDCRGKDQDERKCIERACPVNGNWTEWSSWSTCSRTCNIGNKERNRTCSNPSPQFGGLACEGLQWDIDNCFEIRCPINGGWADWSLWTACTVTCNYGVRHKHRTCTAPKPRYGGTDCPGTDIGNQTCAINDCPKPKAVKKVEFKPTEAPGAVGIGMIGLSFCFVLIAFFVTLDIITLGRHISYMKRNLAHYCGKYKACAPKPLKRRKSRKSSRKYLQSPASINSDDDNTINVIFEDEVLSNGINHHSNHISCHENKALIDDDEGGGSGEVSTDVHEENTQGIDNHNNLNINDEPKELHHHQNISNLYKRQIYDFDSTRL